MNAVLEPELIELLGEDAYVALAEAFGGIRLFVPQHIDDDHAIAKAIGIEAARRLAHRYAPDRLTIPLSRHLLAKHYRAAGDSNPQIARKLRMSERGLKSLFARGDATIKGSALPPSPLPLFPDE